MKLIRKGTKRAEKFVGECRTCGAEFEANRNELQVEPGSQLEPGEFAHANCTECGAKAGFGAVLLYPKKQARTTYMERD